MVLDILRRTDKDSERFGARVPPDQHLTESFPFVTHGGTPRVARRDWRFQVGGAVNEELFFMPQDEPGFWEQYGYHLRGDPWKEERYS